MRDDLRMVKGSETKRRLLETAMAIVAAEGLQGVSAKKVADASVISKSSVFHHFRSVDELLQELLLMITRNLSKELAQPHTSAEEYLYAIGAEIFQSSNEEALAYTTLLHYVNAALYTPEYRDVLLQSNEEMIDAMTNQLSLFSQKPERQLKQVAEMIVVTLDGYGIHYLLEPDRTDWREIWSLHVKGWLQLL
ncbi:TetR/AcrR family transcriptional regulator [Bacillus daqingensis]|uniref:TetR/AcrR family transcriptional regulator n=1 Tax=Bacillus daqingensis TaxID=872396 RepID=A0ABV9NSP1_9BACI